MLLASPDRIQGTDSHENSRMEDGIAGAVEENARLLDFPRDSDSEEEPSSIKSRVTLSKPRSTTVKVASSDTSGEQTPITYQQHPSPISSTTKFPSSGSETPVVQENPDILPDDTTGSKPCRPRNSQEDRRPLLAMVNKCTKIFRGIYSDIETAFSQSACKILTLGRKVSAGLFNLLPTIVQSALQKIGHALSTAGRVTWAFMNPPLWAMLAAIVVASIPDLQRVFFTNGTFVKNSVTSAIDQNAGVAVPLILVVLGGNLARSTIPHEKPEDDEDPDDQGIKLLIAALISRMLLPFLIMAPILALTAKYVPISILDDPIFVIVCFLITGAPSALQLAQICQINNVYMQTMSRLLFQSYVVWILPSTLILGKHILLSRIFLSGVQTRTS